MQNTTLTGSQPAVQSAKASAQLDSNEKSETISRPLSPLLLVCTSHLAASDEPSGAESDCAVEVELPLLGSHSPLSPTANRIASPLAWSQPDSANNLHDSPTSTEPANSINIAIGSNSSGSNDGESGSGRVNSPRVNSQLVPTAAPFTFKPNPDAKEFIPPAPKQSHQLGSLALLDTPHFVPSTSQFANAPALGRATEFASLDGREAEHSFDEQGRLVCAGAAYNIADEILAMQAPPSRPFPLNRSLSISNLPEPQYNAHSYEHPHGDGELWQGRYAYQLGSVPSHALPPTPPHSVRERSSSLGSAHSSHFQSKLGNGFVDPAAAQRAHEHAALQSYFGPSSVEVNPPPGSFARPVIAYADMASASRYTSSTASRNLPDVSDESPLYVAAREAFVATSVRTFSPAEAAAAATTFITHFDRAMKTAYPLATLYSISKEKAAELAANPSSSGVDELVLRVAARRMGIRSAEVGGPSANNRKLGLYKTELCRSWEEKGSCRYGAKCQFAHGQAELRPVARHPKFKSEVCRTFLTSGICPYGARCVFKHSTEPAAESCISSSLASLSFGHSANSAGPNPDDPAQGTSRLGLRTPAQPPPNAAFGPALANYLGPGTSPSYSASNSPVLDRFRFSESSVPFPSAETRRLSISVAPGEVPPQFAEAPQSRLQRISQMSSGGSNSSVSSTSTLAGAALRPRASFDNFAGGAHQFSAQSTPQRHTISGHSLSRQPSFTNPFNPAAGTAMSSTAPAPTTATPRHASTSSRSSLASSGAYSTFSAGAGGTFGGEVGVKRQESSSSLSSFTSSSAGAGTLKPAGSEWFAQAGASTEWDAPTEEDSFADFSPLPSGLGLGLEHNTVTPSTSRALYTGGTSALAHTLRSAFATDPLLST